MLFGIIYSSICFYVSFRPRYRVRGAWDLESSYSGSDSLSIALFASAPATEVAKAKEKGPRVLILLASLFLEEIFKSE